MYKINRNLCFSYLVGD